MATTFRNDQRRTKASSPPVGIARKAGSHRKLSTSPSHITDGQPFDRVGELLRRERLQRDPRAERALLGPNLERRSNGSSMCLGGIMAGASFAFAGTVAVGIACGGGGGPAAVSTATPDQHASAAETVERAPAGLTPRALPSIVSTTAAQPAALRPAAEPVAKPLAGRVPDKPATRARVEPVASRAVSHKVPLASPALTPQLQADPPPPAVPRTAPDGPPAAMPLSDVPVAAVDRPADRVGAEPGVNANTMTASRLQRERVGTESATSTPPPLDTTNTGTAP